jgi:hypothetical protein
MEEKTAGNRVRDVSDNHAWPEDMKTHSASCFKNGKTPTPSLQIIIQMDAMPCSGFSLKAGTTDESKATKAIF